MSFPQALSNRHNENNTLHKSNQSHSPSLPSHAHWSICRFLSFLRSSSFVFPSRLLNSFTVVRQRERERESSESYPRVSADSSCSCSSSYCGSPSSSDFPLFCGRSRFFGAAIYIFFQVILAGEYTSVCVCASGFRKTVRQRERTGLRFRSVEREGERGRERVGLRFVCFLCCFSDQDCGAWICSKLCSRLHSFLSSCWRNDYDKSCSITTKCRNAMEDRLKKKRSRSAAASCSFFP